MKVFPNRAGFWIPCVVLGFLLLSAFRILSTGPTGDEAFYEAMRRALLNDRTTL